MSRKKSRKVKRRSKKREENIFDFGLDMPEMEVPPLDLGLGLNVEQKKTDPNKIPKIKLVEILSSRLTTNQIYHLLMDLGKHRHRLADNFLNEVEFVNKKYDKMLMEVEGKFEEKGEEKLLKDLVEEIVNYIKKDFYMEVSSVLKPKDEKDFSKQSLPFLVGVLSPIKSSYERIGIDIKIEREKIISERERIDLLITVGKARIGIELKYNPTEMSEFDHLMAQIDRYIPYIDYLVIVSYSPLTPWLIKKIKEKEIKNGKPLKVVTPNRII